MRSALESNIMSQLRTYTVCSDSFDDDADDADDDAHCC